MLQEFILLLRVKRKDKCLIKKILQAIEAEWLRKMEPWKLNVLASRHKWEQEQEVTEATLSKVSSVQN